LWKGDPVHVGILGGTGPAGRGLAVRLAAAGHTVTVGSRDQARAGATVDHLVQGWPSRGLELRGEGNVGASGAEVVVVATPWEAAMSTVAAVGEHLAGKVVVSVGVAMVRQGREMLPLQLPRGSVAESLQAALPGSRVVAAFHHLPASQLEQLDHALDTDVLICSDHGGASMTVVGLVESIAGLRPIEVGTLAQAAALEALTSVCATVNMRYRVQTSVRLQGI
jgi:8-hydroxy-5-deazaflavin:NADPH oxidoreductase